MVWARGFEPVGDPAEAQFEQFCLGPQRMGGIEIAARFGAAVTHDQQIGDAEQADRHQQRGDERGPGGRAGAPLIRYDRCPEREAEPERGQQAEPDPGVAHQLFAFPLRVVRGIINVQYGLLQ